MEQVWLNNYHSSVPKEINIQEYQSLVHLFNTAVKKFKNQPAFTNFGKTISYNELDKLSNQFASYLSDTLKLEKGDRIAIQMPNLLQYPIAMFGALKAGLIVVNTNPLYTSREMKHQFKDSGAKAIVIFANSAKDLETIIKDTSIEHVVVTEIGDMLGFAKGTFYNFAVKYLKKMVPKYNLPASVSFKNALSQGSPNYKPVDFNQTDIAFLQYTGGTTGVSKGAILTHKNILANTLQIFAWLKPKLKEGKEIMITPLPLYHIFSLTVNCLALMSYGAHNILITNPRDIDGFIKELKKWPFTVMTSLNTLFNALLNNEKLKEVDFSNCHFGVAGGMAMQNFVAKEWKKVTGTDVVEGYGLTEASPVVTCNPTDGNHRMGSVGMPLPSTQVKLVTESGEAVGVGEEGELLVKGPQVMGGYWNLPDETRNVITDDGWLKTGDVAVMGDDGYFKIVDRKKDMIIVSGFNVYPNEIEEILVNHPNILELAAIGEPHPESGEVIKICVVKKGEVTKDEIKEYARKYLTGYKIPKIIEFHESLPKSNVGKILRKDLRSKPSA